MGSSTSRASLAHPAAGRRMVLLVTAAVLAFGLPSAQAGAHPRASSPTAVTRAALDPALVAGRGASVDFVEQEAEKAATDGTVIGPDRSPYTLPAEASGREAVRLAPGRHVEFTLPRAANA